MEDEPGGPKASVDVIFDALADQYRRRLLITLMEHDRRADGDEGIAVPQDETTRMHLSKLDELDVVRWDRESDRISEGPRFEDFRPLLRKVRD